MKKYFWKLMFFLTILVFMTETAMPVRGLDPCTKAGCRNMRLDGSRFCEEHECVISGCHYERADGTVYCRMHKERYKYNITCLEPGCSNLQKDGSLYCYRHTCTKPGCTNKRMNGSDFCSNHTANAVKKQLSQSSKPNGSKTQKKKKTYYYDDPYDVWDYVDGDDFASEWEDSGDYEDYEDALDYYEEVVGHD